MVPKLCPMRWTRADVAFWRSLRKECIPPSPTERPRFFMVQYESPRSGSSRLPRLMPPNDRTRFVRGFERSLGVERIAVRIGRAGDALASQT